MKKVLIAFSLMFAIFLTTNSAKAQIENAPDVIAAAGNLVNLQVGDVNVNLVDVVDVTNVLNNNDVRALNNILNGLTIDNVLNNLLRDAEIIKDNQIVVGAVVNVLGGVEQVLVTRRRGPR
jgi:hypothetical protein